MKRPLWFIPALCLLSACATGILPGENGKILQNLGGEYFAIATAYADLGKYDQALTYFTYAMRDKNYYTAGFYESARMNVFLSRWDQARSMYETLLAKDPHNKDLRSSLAYIEGMSGNLPGAESLYGALLGDFPWEESFHENYIRVLAAQEKKEEALAAFAAYTEQFPAGASLKALTELTGPFKEKTEESAEGAPAEGAPEGSPDAPDAPAGEDPVDIPPAGDE
ncbi:MAG: tetratricopeptide repeat protein [Spirochaetaceae bacterium]|jgi:tetratricopeptide (TPR) repeat protein|nr:tetratricopeptide repeat protein [Spirochaetaceae bacterium]